MPSTLTVWSAPSSRGQRERLLVRVDDDDLGRRVGLQALDADVAEAARADHDALRAGAEDRDRLLDGVDRGQAGVGERRDLAPAAATGRA